MPTITIDENTFNILNNIGEILSNGNKLSTHSDAIRHLAKSTVNLCQHCDRVIYTCHGHPVFCSAKNDFVYDCDEFVLLKGKSSIKTNEIHK